MLIGGNVGKLLGQDLQGAGEDDERDLVGGE
jgi:hypothetical protein